MIVTAQGVSKDFIRQGRGTNRFTAVQPLDLRIEPGKFTLLMGRSGSGKSTLLNILSGLLTPTSGKVLYDDRDIYAMDDEALSRFRNGNIGVIPQGQTAIHGLSVLENVCLTYMIYGSEEERLGARAAAIPLMERLGIAGLAEASPSELSGGELRRMVIARALLREPGVIFADEPTCDLDDENTELVLSVLREATGKGAAVFVVSHERDAIGYADVILGMNAGVVEGKEISGT